MTRAAAIAGLALALAACRAEPHTPAAEPARPSADLALLTGLPLAFGEGFGLAAPKNPVMTALEAHYRVRLVDGPEPLGPGGLLLAAQPRALTAARLVALDRWVRDGGRLVLLADPRLTWPSDLPFGDRGRPPTSFADTGLLAHWGLAEEAPPPGATAAAPFTVAGVAVSSDSAGTLTGQGGACRVAVDGRSARCRLGKGWASIVADADFLRRPGGTDALLALLAEPIR